MTVVSLYPHQQAPKVLWLLVVLLIAPQFVRSSQLSDSVTKSRFVNVSKFKKIVIYAPDSHLLAVSALDSKTPRTNIRFYVFYTPISIKRILWTVQTERISNWSVLYSQSIRFPFLCIHPRRCSQRTDSSLARRGKTRSKCRMCWFLRCTAAAIRFRGFSNSLRNEKYFNRKNNRNIY